MSISKSLITNTVKSGLSRSLINPVNDIFRTISSSSSSSLEVLNAAYLTMLERIKNNYGRHIVTKTYESIPRSQEEYINLLTQLRELQDETKNNEQLTLLLDIVEQTLIGSINSYTLYGENVIMAVDKSRLERKVEQILSEVNKETTTTSASITNTFAITQNVQLAAVYNYYIMIYGMPCADEGFDPIKLTFLVETLRGKGIDPYA